MSAFDIASLSFTVSSLLIGAATFLLGFYLTERNRGVMHACIIKRDMEIELTESGKALLDRWRHTGPTRIEKLKPVSTTTVTPLEKVTFVKAERVGYSGRIIIDENISRTIKEMSEQLNVLTREVSGVRYEFREAMQENEAKRLARKSYEKYIT